MIGATTGRKPRLGFAGVGWIGRSRLEAVATSGVAEIVAIADPEQACRAAAGVLAPDAVRVERLDQLWGRDLDGVVIATPSALHSDQTIAALERGMAVFCQKPLGRDASETRRVVEAARRANRLLAVDYSYRQTTAMQRIRAAIQAGELGRVFAAQLEFHNAYGPDKPWFYDLLASGGGCMMDLGTHLVDLVLWVLGFPAVTEVRSQLIAAGEPLGANRARPAPGVEDLAMVQLRLANGVAVQLACSWRLSAGRDAAIEASFYGTQGGATMRNLGGSFYDFTAALHHGTQSEPLCEPPDAWGGRAIVEWANRLRAGHRFDADSGHLVKVAEVLDRVYRDHARWRHHGT